MLQMSPLSPMQYRLSTVFSYHGIILWCWSYHLQLLTGVCFHCAKEKVEGEKLPLSHGCHPDSPHPYTLDEYWCSRSHSWDPEEPAGISRMWAEGQSRECEMARSALVPWGSCGTAGEAVGACAATFLMVFRFLVSPEWYRLGPGL